MIKHSLKTFEIFLTFIMITTNMIDCLIIDLVPIKTKFNQTERIKVILRYENNRPNPILIKSHFLPDGQLNSPILSLTRDGKRVKYIGRIAKLVADTFENCIQLGPNKSINRTIDISLDYNLTESGLYKIQFGSDADTVIFYGTQENEVNKEQQQQQEEVDKKNPDVTVFIEGRTVASREPNATTDSELARGLVGFRGCSIIRQSLVKQALSLAGTYADNAISYLNKTKPSNRPRFVTWFGNSIVAKWRRVSSNFQKLSQSLKNKVYTIDCTCTEKGVFAYVFSNYPYTIHTCPQFWTTTTGGADSRAGTLIHEASHFSVLVGTDDYAYGQDSCKSLARMSPLKALYNADTYEYFAENTPGLS